MRGEAEQVQSQPLPDSAVVAERGGVVVTLGDLRAKLRNSLPADKRRGFFSDGARTAALIDDVLATRQLAVAAREKGLDEDPALRAEVEMFETELLARRHLVRYLDSLDAPDYELLARERYLANKATYALPESRDVRHILIRSTSGHSEEEAKALAQEAHRKLLAGEDFDAVFKEYAEAADVEHGGWLRGIHNDGSLEDAFADAAFAMTAPGDVSAPVLTPFGYHVILVTSITPARSRSFEEMKDQLIDEIKGEIRLAARTSYVGGFTSQPLKLNDETMKQLPTQE